MKIFPFCDSRKNTEYKRRQVFDVICVEIAYTTSVVMLWKFKRMSSPYYSPPCMRTLIQRSYTQNCYSKKRLSVSHLVPKNWPRDEAPSTCSSFINFIQPTKLQYLMAKYYSKTYFSQKMVHLQYWRVRFFLRNSKFCSLFINENSWNLHWDVFVPYTAYRVRYLVLRLEDKLKILEFRIFRWSIPPFNFDVGNFCY